MSDYDDETSRLSLKHWRKLPKYTVDIASHTHRKDKPVIMSCPAPVYSKEQLRKLDVFHQVRLTRADLFDNSFPEVVRDICSSIPLVSESLPTNSSYRSPWISEDPVPFQPPVRRSWLRSDSC